MDLTGNKNEQCNINNSYIISLSTSLRWISVQIDLKFIFIFPKLHYVVLSTIHVIFWNNLLGCKMFRTYLINIEIIVELTKNHWWC